MTDFDMYYGLSPATGQLPRINPQDEESLLSRLGQKALSGLGYLGQSLDKMFGGRAIRGVLGGKPREALSIIPFSDTLGITSPEDITYGRDLLEKAGLLAPNQEGIDAGDVLGFLGEMALDPAMYLHPFGALTKAGQAFEKAGALPKGLANKIRGVQYTEENLRGLRPVAEGALEPGLAVPARSTIAPVEVTDMLRQEGIDLVPQMRRVEAPAEDISRTLHKEFPQGPPGVGFEDAMTGLGRGTVPAEGELIGRGSEKGYQRLNVDRLEGPAQQLGGSQVTRQAIPFVDEAVGQPATPLAGLLGIGLPFQQPSLVLGTGERAAKVAEYLDAAGGFLKGLAPVRGLRALFDPNVKRMLGKEAQEVASEIARPVERRVMSDYIGQAHDLRRELEPVITRVGKPEVDRLLLRAAEGVPIPATFQEYAAELAQRDPRLFKRLTDSGDLENIAGQFAKIQDIADRTGEIYRGTREAERAIGVPTPELSSDLDYVMRQRTRLPDEEGNLGLMQRLFGQSRPALPTGHSSMLARDELFKHFPEGTSQINDLFRLADAQGNPLLVGPNRVLTDLEAEALLRKELTKNKGGLDHPRGLIENAKQEAQALGMDPAEEMMHIAEAAEIQKRVNAQAKEMAGYMKRADPRYATQGVDYFASDPLMNLVFRGAKTASTRSSAEALYEAIRRNAAPLADLGEDAVTVPRLLEQAGLTARGPGGQSVGELLAAQRIGVQDLADLGAYGLKPNVAEELVKPLRAWSAPDELIPALAGYDKFMNLFKGWITAPFPAFHTRNALSGLYNMFRDSAFSPTALREAKDVLQGRAGMAALPGMKAAGTGQEVLDELLRELASQRVAFTSGAHRTGERLVSTGEDLRRLAETIPGRVGQDISTVLEKVAGVARPGQAGDIPLRQFLEQMGVDAPRRVAELEAKLGGRAIDDLAVPLASIPDVRGITAGEALDRFGQGFKGGSFNPFNTENVMLKQSRAVGESIEDWMRTAHYLAKRKQGFTPAAAAEAVRKYHFDYTDLTPFERNVMRRIMPFYTFTSRNLPNVLTELATSPGKLAAPIRAGTGGLARGDEFVPPYLREGVALPIGGAPEGFQRYLSSFGLPFEDEAIRAIGSLGAGQLQRALGSIMGGMTPALKYPIEVATGTQLNTGRKLSDLRPTGVGSLLSAFDEDLAGPISQLLQNTPLSRSITTVDKLLDTLPGGRKDVLETLLNLNTGFRITDQDLARQKSVASREIIQDLLQGKPGVKTFEKLYVTPEKLPNLSPEELVLYSLYRQLEGEALKAAKARKK